MLVLAAFLEHTQRARAVSDRDTVDLTESGDSAKASVRKLLETRAEDTLLVRAADGRRDAPSEIGGGVAPRVAREIGVVLALRCRQIPPGDRQLDQVLERDKLGGIHSDRGCEGALRALVRVRYANASARVKQAISVTIHDVGAPWRGAHGFQPACDLFDIRVVRRVIAADGCIEQGFLLRFQP